MPNGLATECRGPKLSGAHPDVQGRVGFTGRCVSITITADRLGAGGCGPNCDSKIVGVRGPIGQQRVSLKVQHFAATIADLLRAAAVGEAQQSPDFFKASLPASG